jgi:adenylate kinase
MGRRLLLLGAPGAGKGTQAAMLCRALGVPHVSSGVMLRDHVGRGTPLGARARAIMEAGELVPDDVVVAMVAERLAQPDAGCGFLLDGFPRTLPQAEALDEVMEGNPLETVVSLDVDEEEVVARLLARAEKEGRSDDNEATIRTRLAVYREQTEPLISHYGGRGIVLRVNGMGTIEEVFGRLALVLAAG